MLLPHSSVHMSEPMQSALVVDCADKSNGLQSIWLDQVNLRARRRPLIALCRHIRMVRTFPSQHVHAILSTILARICVAEAERISAPDLPNSAPSGEALLLF